MTRVEYMRNVRLVMHAWARYEFCNQVLPNRSLKIVSATLALTASEI